MDYLPSMMGFDQTDDELFQSDSYPCQLIISPTDQQQLETHALLPCPTAVEVSQICTHRQTALGRGRKRKAAICLNEMNGDSPHETKRKKMVRREIERQRRQEIATYYASLRSLLPLDYLKGKRSMSDHMIQAVSYIKHLQKNIQELSDKRDELKRNINPNSVHSNNNSPRDSTMDSLTVRPCSVGMEVIINTALTGGIPLSKVTAVLLEEGFSVVNCISTKVNERLLNIIESEVSDGRSIQPCELEQKMINVLIKSQNV